MKKIIIDTVAELRCGMKLLCPESTGNGIIEVSPKTNFYVDRNGYWGVDCPICGESHLLNYVYRLKLSIPPNKA